MIPRIPRRALACLLGPALLAGLGLPGPARSQATGSGSGPPAATAPLPALAPGNPFADVPPDHWAVEALRQLQAQGVLAGLVEPGDPFEGRKVMTRYELAVLLGKLLGRIEEARRQGTEVRAEERLVQDLTREFRAELQILGVRTDAFQARLGLQEARVQALERRRSNIKVDGFYRATQHFTEEPFNPVNYRFSFPDRPFPFDQLPLPQRQFFQRGLSPLEQEIFLRVLGRASPGNQLGAGVEAFAEIKARLSGIQQGSLYYRYGNPPVVGDSAADSFATDVIDDKRVSFHRGHVILDTDFLDLRLFANEAPTEPGDPSRLFAVDPGRSPGTPARVRVPSIRDLDDGVLDLDSLFLRDPYRSPGVPAYYLTPRPFDAFSGVEAGGEAGKWTYFASVLSDLEETYFPGDDRYDLQRVFLPARTTQIDNYALRLTYEPWRFLPGSGKEVLVGLTYNETAFSYDFEDDRNRVVGVDVQYQRRRKAHELEYTAQVLASAGRGAHEDLAYRLDARYRQGGFLGLFKGYYYGYDFQALTAQDPFVDTDVHFNFLRTRPLVPGPDTRGERLARTQLRYTFDPERLTTLDNLTVEAMYEVKAFDRDPLNPRGNDFEPASRFYLQAIADIDSRIHVEFQSEIQKDLPQETATGGITEEEGALINDLRIDYRPVRKVGISGELSFIDDFDARAADGAHFSFKRQRLELSVQPTPAIFLKGAFENIENADLTLLGLPRIPVNGRNFHRFIGEGAFTLTSNFGLKGLWVNQVTENNGESGAGTVVGGPPPGNGESNLSKIFSGEANWQLSRALEFRWVYGFQSTDLFQSDNTIPGRGGIGDLLDDFVNLNHFVALKYLPTEKTEVVFSYGDEYENPNDPIDNGPASFHKTVKVYRLTAQTNF